MINVLRSLVVLAALLACPLAAQADVFLRVLAPGSTTGGSNNQTVSLRITPTTPLPMLLRVDARTDGMGSADLTGATVQYFLDEQPVSPMVTGPTTGTSLFTWGWTPPAGFKGVHILQVKVTGGPVGAVYKSFSTMVFGAPDLGPQRLPALPPFVLAGTSLSPQSESPAVGWFQYLGTQPKLPSLPLREVPAPAFPPPDPNALLGGGGWILEPWTNTGHNYAQATPRLCYEPSGQPWVCKWYPQAGNLSRTAADDVLRDLHTDGPRGTNATSPYSTCVTAPDAAKRAWTCIDLSGRIYNVSTVGHVTTLVGPWQACDSCPVQWRGDFEGGLRFNAPNDLSYDILEPTLLYVADTYNHRIAKVDLSVSPPKITTLAGSASGTKGYLDGPGLAAQFHAPFSVINHGPHPCPGRPEFIDCVHIYVADTMNKAIRVLDLHRHGEIPPVVTLLGSPAKGTDSDTAFSNPTPWVQPCTKDACSVNWPMVIRWDSDWNLVIGETVTGAIRRWRWSTGLMELVTVRPGGKSTPMRGSATDPLPGWLWLDVDRKGEVGPKNDILWATSQTSSGDMYRVSADGTRINIMDGSGSVNQGQARYSSDAPGHYTWQVSIGHGEIVTTGFGAVGMRKWRPFGPTDHKTDLNATVFSRGRTLMGQYPEIAVLYGSPRWWTRLGLKTGDELACLSDTDLFAQLRQWAPTLTDAQAKDWAYAMRWVSLRAMVEPILVGVTMGACAAPPIPPPTQFQLTLTKAGTGDGTLSGAGSYVDGTTATAEGTPVAGSQFVNWSGSSGCAATTPKITIVMKANTTCTATFNLIPPPPTVDTFTGAPLSVELGQPAVLTWATSNATAVTINGVVVPVDGTQTVTPTTTTHYDLLADGISRRVTIAVTLPPPPEDREVTVNGAKYRIIEVTP